MSTPFPESTTPGTGPGPAVPPGAPTPQAPRPAQPPVPPQQPLSPQQPAQQQPRPPHAPGPPQPRPQPQPVPGHEPPLRRGRSVGDGPTGDPGGAGGTRTAGLNPVSPKYAMVKLLGSGIGTAVMILVCAGAGVAGLLFDLTWLTILGFALAALFVVWFVIEAFITVRQVKAIGYLQRQDDLLIQRGILFRSTLVVPYGRLQYVEVSAGPLLRMAGLASLDLHTASASTDASLPGLPRAEAQALRDSLASRGGAKLAGL